MQVTQYVENPKEFTKVLELMNEFCKVTGYKIKLQKSTVFLHTTNKQSESEIKNNCVCNSIKMNKICRNKFNKREQSL